MLKKAILSLSLLTFGVLSAPVSAQTSEGTLLHNPAKLSWETKGNDKKMKVVEAATPSGQAISARMKKRKKKAWDVALWVDLDGGVKKGDLVQMKFWARTAKAPKKKAEAEFVVFVGRNEEPYDFIISEEFSPSSKWKSYTLTGVAKADYSAGQIKAEYQLGKQIQTVEFGAMYVSNLGPQTNVQAP